jgi:hypothetical protein
VVTSPVPTFCTRTGMPFAPTNGVAAVHRRMTVAAEAQAAAEQAREEQERQERIWKRTSRGKR